MVIIWNFLPIGLIVIMWFDRIYVSGSSCPPGFESCKLCEIVNDVSINIQTCASNWIGNDSTAIDLENNIRRIISENSRIKGLFLENAPLKSLTDSVCHLTGLNYLGLYDNRLEIIPVGCFKDFKEIKSIIITNNGVRFLDKGVFDGLTSLEYLEMGNNLIERIDEEVFSINSGLVNLKHLGLTKNKLISVGAWIFSIPLNSFNGTTISLEHNNISKFTNSFNWTFNCSDRPKRNVDIEIQLTNNNIDYISDIINPYFKSKINIMCLVGIHHFILAIRNNPLICDCTDYQYAILGRGASYSSTFDDVQCGRPIHMQNKKFLSVPIHQMVCERKENCISGCVCIEQPSTSTFYVYCNNSGLNRVLPESVPTTKLHHYFLSFDGNHFSQMDSRKYFVKTNYLDISNSKISSISSEFVMSINNIEVVHLHGNLLRALPKEIFQSETFSIKELSLYNNPWNCDCENKWMKSWLNKSKHMLIHSESMHCQEPHWNKGKSILEVDDEDFCSNPYETKQNRFLLIILIPILVFITLILTIGFFVWKFKVEIHAKFNIHPFDRDACNGEHMLYDVFISSSYQDRRFAIDLVRALESKGYQVCYQEKDFFVGPSISSNICRAVVYSKRVICILSEDFLKSPYCLYEFKVALHRHIEIKKKRLIALLHNSFTIRKEIMTEELYEFLMTHAYVEVRDENSWMDKLCYSLTVNTIPKSTQDIGLLEY